MDRYIDRCKNIHLNTEKNNQNIILDIYRLLDILNKSRKQWIRDKMLSLNLNYVYNLYSSTQNSKINRHQVYLDYTHFFNIQLNTTTKILLLEVWLIFVAKNLFVHLSNTYLIYVFENLETNLQNMHCSKADHDITSI